MIVTRSALFCTTLSAIVYTEHWESFRWLIAFMMVFLIFFLCRVITSDIEIAALIQAVAGLFTLFAYARSMWGKDSEKSCNNSISSKEKQNNSVVAVQQSKKRTRKDKKRKKRRNMDDDSENAMNAPERTTKVYRPLQQFVNLDMSNFEMYTEFLPYVLGFTQLKKYGFPLDDPKNPGRLITKSCGKRTAPLRHCHRCGAEFQMTEGNKYESEGTCIYHPKRITSYRGVPGAGNYLCCNGNYMSKGCKTFRYHVSAEHFLDDVDFKRVRGKRQVRGGQSCGVYALDCEMCYTTGGLEVTKIGVIGIDGLTLYETFVQPENLILDYNTIYSGVTANDLKGVKTTLSDVQAFLLKLLNKDSILVGHGLENDLKALRIIHEKVVDTSVVFPHQFGGLYKKSLKNLAHEFLKKTIQDSSHGHDCIEDARTCMELMLTEISKVLQERPPVIQDENKNSFLQNCPQSSYSMLMLNANLPPFFYPDTHFYVIADYGDVSNYPFGIRDPWNTDYS